LFYVAFLLHRSTAISNWQLLIQTVCVQLLFRRRVLGSWIKVKEVAPVVS